MLRFFLNKLQIFFLNSLFVYKKRVKTNGMTILNNKSYFDIVILF